MSEQVIEFGKYVVRYAVILLLSMALLDALYKLSMHRIELSIEAEKTEAAKYRALSDMRDTQYAGY
jgi:hypothetical protein